MWGATDTIHSAALPARDFNPRARVGRDLTCLVKSDGWTYFNPRARVGRDPGRVLISSVRSNFNPRARVGRDLDSIPVQTHGHNFNPRARVGRDKKFWLLLMRTGHFNPRARVGRDSFFREFCRSFFISIHAPAWGATVPVYTGLITAVTLYFSRTSFLAVLLQAFFVAKSSV